MARAAKARGRRRWDAALEGFDADAVISTGFCGAVDPELAIADVVVGSEVTCRKESASRRRFRRSTRKASHGSGVLH